MNFGARLTAVAALVPAGTSLIDVGTDHAYLPVLLWQKKKLAKAIAADIAEGPCEAATRTVKSYGLTANIEIRRGDGLKVVKPGEVETAVLAGMGAATMLKILEAAPELVQRGAKQLRWLVLQPMSDSELIRHWAQTQGWAIVREDLVKEAGKIYEILLLTPQKAYKYPGATFEVGAYLFACKHPLLTEYLQLLIDKYGILLKSMEKSKAAVHSEKYQAILAKRKQLEVLYNENNSN